jgi:hypothetical protein
MPIGGAFCVIHICPACGKREKSSRDPTCGHASCPGLPSGGAPGPIPTSGSSGVNTPRSGANTPRSGTSTPQRGAGKTATPLSSAAIQEAIQANQGSTNAQPKRGKKTSGKKSAAGAGTQTIKTPAAQTAPPRSSAPVKSKVKTMLTVSSSARLQDPLMLSGRLHHCTADNTQCCSDHCTADTTLSAAPLHCRQHSVLHHCTADTTLSAAPLHCRHNTQCCTTALQTQHSVLHHCTADTTLSV